ncbi:MAG: hypothetical protein GHCLOJNM_00596 [bacterium]|nr:hypothetical protein [bacterium]
MRENRLARGGDALSQPTSEIDQGLREEARNATLRLVLPLAMYKVFVLLFVFLSVEFLPPIFSKAGYHGNFHWPPDGVPNRTSVFRTWDGEQYLFLSEHGYRAGMMASAFYPLWPFCIRVGAGLFGGNHLVSGLVLSNLFSLVGILGFHYLAFLWRGAETARAATLLLLAFPGALFFSFVYSESLFFLLSVLFFLFVLEGKHAATAWVAFLLPLTRSVGIFVLVPYLAWLTCSWRNKERIRSVAWLPVFAVFIGYAFYFTVFWASTGDPFEGFKAQRLFIANSTVGKLVDFKGFLAELVTVQDLHGILGSLLDRLWFILFLLSLPGIRKLGPVWFWYALPLAVVPAMTVSFMAFTRYVEMVFPMFLAWGVWFSREERKVWLGVIAGMFYIVQVCLLIRHVNFHWAG